MAREWHAVGAFNRALGSTSQLLFRKPDLWFWLKLSLVVFLAVGGSSFNPSSFLNRDSGDGSVDFMQYLPLLVAVFSIILIIGLVFSFIRAVCQFMFIESLIEGRTEIADGFRRNLDNGFSLFLFNLLVGFASIAILLAFLAPVIYYAFISGVEPSRPALFVSLVYAIGIFILVGVVSGIVGSFTTDFVTVLMYKNVKGVVYCWKRLAGLIKNNTNEFLVYMLVGIASGLAAGVILFIVDVIVTIAAIVIAIIPALGLIVVGGGLGLALGKGILVWLLIPALAVVIAYFMVVSYITVVLTLPVHVFFRYYSMGFIHRIEPTLGVMAEKLGGEEGGEKAVKTEVKGRPKKKLMVY
jgi:hypothetical protein